MRWMLFPLLVTLLPLLTACGDEPSRQTTLPSFSDPDLIQGKNTWMRVCRACHLTGVAGAPAIADADAWEERLEKGRPALYQNAIDGIATAQGWSMPPRGGEDRLTDRQIQLAVDYMLAAQDKIAANPEK